MLLKEKEFTRARDVLAAERRRMPWMAVEKDYRFEGPEGVARRTSPRSPRAARTRTVPALAARSLPTR